MAVVQSQMYWLILRHREQAPSHILIFIGFEILVINK